ncbi:hypothetical protein [Dietzia cinnamea]|uniref:hypothetical protein n=1 Tax=Dietzia cinnamea TaxID=321318 RepID=UPI0021A6B2F0|nr:hypothetical protein [Dietzia cinnamea]MCT2122576.1 hypothetical protein [Dietzia cinnamea]MCT2145863.1 hypothetical protein [Dietzia cinnamea]MCT2305956.1 hypothetical protein [Dietzia cinnamea]
MPPGRTPDLVRRRQEVATEDRHRAIKSTGGSLDNPVVGAGLILLAGLGVSAALAVSAGIAGGAFELPQIPGLPF